MNCTKCQDGRIYTCMNCYGPAVYDSEFRDVFCNTCEMLRENYIVTVEACPICDPEASGKILDVVERGPDQ